MGRCGWLMYDELLGAFILSVGGPGQWFTVWSSALRAGGCAARAGIHKCLRPRYPRLGCPIMSYPKSGLSGPKSELSGQGPCRPKSGLSGLSGPKPGPRAIIPGCPSQSPGCPGLSLGRPGWGDQNVLSWEDQNYPFTRGRVGTNCF